MRPASVGDLYYAKLRAVGGRPPVSFAITGGKLALGLKLNKKTGVVSGTPKAGGTFRFRVTASDAFRQALPLEPSQPGPRLFSEWRIRNLRERATLNRLPR